MDNRNIRRYSRLFLCLLAMAVFFLAGKQLNAAEKPDIILSSDNYASIRDGGLAYYGVEVTNLNPNVTTTYQWYCSTKAEAAKDIWYKIDKTYDWVKYYKTKQVMVYAEDDQSTWNDSEQRVLRCKVTMDDVSAYSPTILITAKKVEYLNQVKLSVSGSLKPVLYQKQNLNVSSTETSKYVIKAVDWQLYNPVSKNWMTMDHNTEFAHNTSYRIRATVTCKGNYGIQTISGGSVKKTSCYIGDKKASVAVSQVNSEEYYITQEYSLDLNLEENVILISSHIISIYNQPEGNVQDKKIWGVF